MASDEEDHLREVTQNLKKGLDVKDRRWRLRTYKQVFLGTDAVQFFLSEKYATNIADAVVLGSELMAQGVFQHCLRDHPFKNEPLFYRFGDQEAFHGGYALLCSVARLLDSLVARRMALYAFEILLHLTSSKHGCCRVQPMEDGRASSWADLLSPAHAAESSHGSRSLQASLPSEFMLQYDQGQKDCILSPLDTHNLKLLDNVHPPQWANPTTKDK